MPEWKAPSERGIRHGSGAGACAVDRRVGWCPDRLIGFSLVERAPTAGLGVPMRARERHNRMEKSTFRLISARCISEMIFLFTLLIYSAAGSLQFVVFNCEIRSAGKLRVRAQGVMRAISCGGIMLGNVFLKSRWTELLSVLLNSLGC